jgi:hypothetical protein
MAGRVGIRAGLPPLTRPTHHHHRTVPPTPQKKPFSLEKKILLLALAAGLPAILLLEILIWTNDYTPRLRWTLTLLAITPWLGMAFALVNRGVQI